MGFRANQGHAMTKTTDQILLERMAAAEADLTSIETRLSALEVAGGTPPPSGGLASIYDSPTGSTVQYAFALQEIVRDAEIVCRANMTNADQTIRIAACNVIDQMEAIGYPK